MSDLEQFEDRGRADAIELVRGGPTFRLLRRLRLDERSVLGGTKRVLAVLLITWVPLLVLTMIHGDLMGDHVERPFLADPEVHARFLFVLPLLELAELVVATALAVQVRHFVEMGIVPAKELDKFEAAREEAVQSRDSFSGEFVMVVIAYTLAVFMRIIIGMGAGTSSWEWTPDGVTPAGWCYAFVSLPIMYFSLLRWTWVFAIWARFLYRVSRLDLELTATHPDRTGGLGFIGWGQASFALVLMAISAVFSAGMAEEILHHGESLESLKYHLATFLVIALLIIHLPLLSFAGKLSRCRFKGLLEFGALIWRHDRAFDRKWLHDCTPLQQEALLGSPDIQSMPDAAQIYEHVDRMWLMPFDAKAFAVLVLAMLLPMLPLIGTQIPVSEIFSKLFELLI